MSPSGLTFLLPVIIMMFVILFCQITQALQDQTTPKNNDLPSVRDVGNVLNGIARGISNGDLMRSFLEMAGMRRPPGQLEGQGLEPDIPWPTVMTQAFNQINDYLTRLLIQLQVFASRLDSRFNTNRLAG